MKKKSFIIAIAAVFAACNSNPKTGTANSASATTDTASFRNNTAADKGQVIELKGVTDTIVTGDGSRYVKVDPNQQKSVVTAAPVTPAAVAAVPKTTTHRTHTTSHSSSTGSSSPSGGYSGAGTETTSAPAPVVAKKKGWSKAAKGTAIGAGTGAIAGAIISKKKGLGAVIGGVVGGAGGYIIGHNKDKKDGRN